MGDVTVTFLGSGDAFASGGRFYTCFLVEAPDASFLIDCGATAAVAMKQHGVDTTSIDAVI
ncbi:MAG: MBL fold metallo-hydrolase, partial [Candidatus Krumholzibacteria bacterium]|nr:MBL fold metallo-hydrolase [Candidatus Krumholzibacteria bacterium]